MSHYKLTPAFTRKALRFALSGLFVTGVHVIIATVVIEFILSIPSVANGIAFVVATLVSYLMNTLWSFSDTLHKKNLFRFGIVSSIGLFLSMTISGITQYNGLHYWYGITFVVCIVPPFTFILHNFWTYRCN